MRLSASTDRFLFTDAIDRLRSDGPLSAMPQAVRFWDARATCDLGKPF
ncbi:hypothetical protein BURKHO8Y_150125 [Burkholderia sp. 8Y]|nr:hypothetical protein BURKHO8Y_150125 [Burkholderia sp. 8Y]